jgi:drug/metabolite transporter (DMT)-like permease
VEARQRHPHGRADGQFRSGALNTARWAPALLWVVPAMWSSNYIVARLAEGVVTPHVLALGRWSLALLLMLPWLWRELVQAWRLWRAEWRQLLVLGGLGMWICGAFVYQAGHSTSATNIALLYAITPVAIAGLSIQLLHERMSMAQRVAVGFALLGVLLVIAKGRLENLLTLQWSAGDLWALTAALSWTVYSVLLKRWPSSLSPLARLAVIIAAGIVVLLPFTALEVLWVPQPAWSVKALLLIAAAALLPGVLSYGAFSLLQRELGASRTALMLYLAPVYGGLGAWWVLGERPGWHHLAGAALILPSIWLATRK